MKIEKIVDQKLVDITETFYKCDICDNIFKKNTYLTTCCMCGKEVCKTCLANMTDVRDYDHYEGDNRYHYGVNGWNIGKPYVEAIIKLRDTYENDIERVEREWIDECNKTK